MGWLVSAPVWSSAVDDEPRVSRGLVAGIAGVIGAVPAGP
jgi:hypothetical protein